MEENIETLISIVNLGILVLGVLVIVMTAMTTRYVEGRMDKLGAKIDELEKSIKRM